MPLLALREFFTRLPTADLYLHNPLAELGRHGGRVARPRCVSPNAYLAGRTGVVVRYGRAADIGMLRQSGAARIVYIADDDFLAGADDRNLPERYRRKLGDFALRHWPALRDAADIVVVPGAVLAGQYGMKAQIMPPVWHEAPAPLDHFADAPTIEMVHLGTGSHGADLAPLAPLLAGTLNEHPSLRLTLFAGDAAPAALKHHAQVRVRRPMPWWRYRRALPRLRFHLALYPLADTPFNRARSANKLYEHALVGAASLMSPNPALRDAAGSDLAAIFVEGGPEDWAKRLAALLARPSALREIAEAARMRILAAEPARRAADGWREILASESSSQAPRRAKSFTDERR